MDSARSARATETFRALYVFQALPGHDPELEKALVTASTIVRNDAGLVGLTLARSVEIKGGFMVLSRWQDRATLTDCFRVRQQEGLTGTLSTHCASVSFDVLVPSDPPGSRMPTPGVVGTFMVSRVATPEPAHAPAARMVMDEQTRLVQSHPDCLAVMGNTHADRGTFLHSCSFWASRLAWETATQELDLPSGWSVLSGMSDAVSMDFLETILELEPDTPVTV